MRQILIYNRMFGAPLDLEGNRLPDGFELAFDRAKMPQAIAVVFHIPDLGDIRGLPKRRGQIWVAWSMECDANHPRLLDPHFMSQFDLKMTYHLDADVVVPYYRRDFVNVFRSEPREKLETPAVVSLISSPFDRSSRLKYKKELMRHITIDSYGKVLNNKKLCNDKGRQTKLETIAKYKFALAFENAIGPDYVTEKFFDPLIAGSIPIYLGAPNIDEFAPGEQCYINVTDFESAKSLAEHIMYLSEDENAYETYLSWKSKPFKQRFLQLINVQKVHPFVRLCWRIQALGCD